MSWFTGLFGKLAGSVVGGFFKSYGLWVAIGAALAAILSMVIYVHGAEKAKAQVPVLKAEIRTVKADYQDKLNRAAIAVKACTDVNLDNYRKAQEQKAKAEAAAQAQAQAEQDAAIRIGDIQREVDRFRNRNLDCPALDDRFREWLRDD